MSGIVAESASGDQLRRLWTNLKTRQREALTKERQHRLATGGGDPCPDADIDPDIAEIAPALMVEIPNAIDSDLTDSNTQLLSHEELSNETQPSTSTQETIQIIQMPPTSTPETNQSHTFSQNQAPSTQDAGDEEMHSNNEKKLRVLILKKEHLNRERRAQEIHNLEIKILQEKLREAKARADLAEKDLHHKP